MDQKKFNSNYLIYKRIWFGLAIGTKFNGLVSLFLLTVIVRLYIFSLPKTKRQDS